MTLGAVLRCDAGGLGSISAAVAEFVRPSRVLMLDLEEQGRGDCEPSSFAHLDSVFRVPFKGAIPDRALDWICAEGIDSLLMLETGYDPRLIPLAHSAGIKTVGYTMPELNAWTTSPRVTYVPTTWRIEDCMNAQLLPCPVDRTRLPFQLRTEVKHIYATAGAAMLDRNGLGILLAALPFISSEVRVTIRSEKPVDIPATDLDVTVLSSPERNYWDAVPDDVDLLVMPRRYGGLNLVLQECASRGIPALTLQTDVYASEAFVTSIPSTGSRNERMKGAPRSGIPVFSADPRTLATAVDWLVRNPDAHADASRACDVWAEAHSWDGPLGGRWRSLLGADEGN